MTKRIEQVVWQNVQELATELGQVYSVVGMLSAGLLLFSELSPEERERAIRIAKTYKTKVKKQ